MKTFLHFEVTSDSAPVNEVTQEWQWCNNQLKFVFDQLCSIIYKRTCIVLLLICNMIMHS